MNTSEMLDMMALLRVEELAEGDTHPADLPREDLVDRLTMVDSLVRGERGEKRAEDINTVVEARARLAFAQGGPGKHRGRTPIAVGDRVRLSGTFLRNTGQYFKTLERRTGGRSCPSTGAEGTAGSSRRSSGTGTGSREGRGTCRTALVWVTNVQPAPCARARGSGWDE